MGIVSVEGDVADGTGEKRVGLSGGSGDRGRCREVFRFVVGEFGGVGIDAVYEMGELFCPEACEVGRDSESDVMGVDSFEIGQGVIGCAARRFVNLV